MQIPAKDYYWRLKPGVRGMFYWYGNEPVSVTFLGMDGMEVLIEGVADVDTKAEDGSCLERLFWVLLAFIGGYLWLRKV